MMTDWQGQRAPGPDNNAVRGIPAWPRQPGSVRGRILAIGGFLLVVGLLARAEAAGLSAGLARSHSGQFVVRAAPPGPPNPVVLDLETNKNYVRLEPTLLSISCERIKQLLYRKLGTTAPWEGTIYLGLYRTRSADDGVSLVMDRFRDGWQYRVALPDMIERAAYVRTIVRVLLLEMANRGAWARSAEVPLWLSEGFSQMLLVEHEKEIILPPPRSGGKGLNLVSTVVNTRRIDPLEQVRKELADTPPLTFQQLSWPPADPLAGPAGARFRASAVLFLNELLQLTDGRQCLCAMIDLLPRYYNWQFAFLSGFSPHFQRPLDVDKWWTLQTVHFTGRDLAQAWSPEESWQKLDEAIRSAVQVRLGTNDLPLSAEVSLQTMIREWERPRQVQALRSKLNELELVRLRIAPELLPLVDAYRQTIGSYLQQPDTSGVFPFRKKGIPPEVIAETCRQLDALDNRRTALQPPKPAVAVRGIPNSIPNPGP